MHHQGFTALPPVAVVAVIALVALILLLLAGHY
jgi:hypothetical protein